MRKLFGLAIALITITVLHANSYAQVSSAAVLFLRIAAGARAAGMGEAFVAIADDATATHWNPAGLGQYPLASTWFEAKIPEELQPIKKVALYKGESSESGFGKYDIWAITKKGLMRLSRKKWTDRDVVAVRQDLSAEAVIRQYIGATGDSRSEELSAAMNKIGDVNNPFPRERITDLEKSVMGKLREDYRAREDMENAFFALKEAYDSCLINWDKVEQASAFYQKKLNDSTLDNLQADKILTSIESAKKRFLPEELIIPYEINFGGKLNDIVSDDDHLWVAGENGLFRYNGTYWQKFTAEQGLPVNNIKQIVLYKKLVFLGTDSGLILYKTGAFTHYGPLQGLPHKPVDAITVKNENKIWAVIDGDLYTFDGTSWRNYAILNRTRGENIESIYTNMKIYDNDLEKKAYIEKLKMMNTGEAGKSLFGPGAESGEVDVETVPQLMDSLGIMGAFEQKLSSPIDSIKPKNNELTTEILETTAKPVIALFDLDNQDISQGVAATFADRLLSEIIKTDKFTIVDRNKMNEILSEQGMKLTGNISDVAAIRAGHLLNAQKVITGSVSKAGQVYFIAVKLINVETGKTEQVVSYNDKDIELVMNAGMETIAKKLTDQGTQTANKMAFVKEPTDLEFIEADIKVPFTAGFESKVRSMLIDDYGNLWIGTDLGLLRFTGQRWKRYGYYDLTITKDISVYDFALEKVHGDSARAERLTNNIKVVNHLETDSLSKGQTIKIFANPNGSRINDITEFSGRIIFGTSNGVTTFEGFWSRYNLRNLGNRNSFQVEVRGRDVWYITRDKIEINASGRSEITLMHVNWLEQLADDMYYEFFGYTQNVEGWGTVGGNITFLTYGDLQYTDEFGNEGGFFSAFDVALTLSYGTALTSTLSGGISAKIIYSNLSAEYGAGKEKGEGTSTALALDLGLLYKIDPRLTLGLAITNLGPDIAYIDVEQADPLPRNLAIGIAWKMVESEYNRVLLSVEANKSLAERDKTIIEEGKELLANPQNRIKDLFFNPFTMGGITDGLRGVIINGGLEYSYGSFFHVRGGYIHDEEGAIKTPTLGFGLSYSLFQFDFAYIPSSENLPLANTMRFSLSMGW